MHPAIKEELDMLEQRFPNKQELNLADYADYFSIQRRDAAKHFKRINKGYYKIAHKRIGRLIIIPLIDFAYWLAQHKVDINGQTLGLSDLDKLNRRGFVKPDYGYRKLE